MEQFQKGQTVYLEAYKGNSRNSGKDIVEGVVTLVGRVYYTVNDGIFDRKFDKDTLVEHVKFGHGYTLFSSVQAIYDERERVNLRAKVRSQIGSYNFDLTLDQLRRIKAIIDEEDEDGE